MKKTLLFAALTAINIPFSFAQQHWHIKPTPEEITYRKSLPHPQLTSAQKTTANFTMPSDARIPGEFEESRSVAIAWIKDPSTNLVDVTSDYAPIWAQMADAIQKECPVWIRIENVSDSNTIKAYMNSLGTPLTNYKFFLTIGDDFWARDFGPIGFYYGTNDDLGILDMNYYDGRNNDDLFPQNLASTMGYSLIRTNLYGEGGNFITDGFKRSWHSDVIFDENTSTGQPLHSAWTLQQTMDTIKYVWASDQVITTAALQCDGGTGHNDMFMKLMDENTFVIMDYPAVVTAQDNAIIDNVINTISNSKTIYNKPFRVFKMPMPTQDDGKTYLTSCSKLNGDARTFVNGLTVNKTYLMPSFSGSGTGNTQGDADAVKAFQAAAPGYKIVPIDSRLLTQLGGAIHCITMQIPADNPILFWHPPIQDLQAYSSSFHIIAKITNKSGIKTAKCYWRNQGTIKWNTTTLTDSSGYMVGNITGVSRENVIRYYIEATSNNGKTMTKPITAPTGGYYSFYFQPPASVSTESQQHNFVMNPLPNPTTGQFYIPVSFESDVQINACITDVLGNVISNTDFGKRSGMSKLEFDVNNYPAGMYFIKISANGNMVDTKKIMKQ